MAISPGGLVRLYAKSSIYFSPTFGTIVDSDPTVGLMNAIETVFVSPIIEGNNGAATFLYGFSPLHHMARTVLAVQRTQDPEDGPGSKCMPAWGGGQ